MAILTKRLFLFFSVILGTALILLSEKEALTALNQNLESPSKQVDVEHNIILDLTSKTDQIIYDNLIYSSYYCTELNPKQARCSQFKEEKQQTISSLKNTDELYSYKAKNGQAMRVYKTKNGIAHFEFKESNEGVLHRYTFTSVKKASDFASQNKNLFKTENFDWDISYLDYIL